MSTLTSPSLPQQCERQRRWFTSLITASMRWITRLIPPIITPKFTSIRMVCDLAAVLFASFWFNDFFKATEDREGGIDHCDVWEFTRVAELQASAFSRLAADILHWFPESHYCRHDAAVCSTRVAKVSADISDLVADVTAWKLASNAHRAIKDAAHPPVADFLKTALMDLAKVKSDDEHDLFDRLATKYPYFMHVWFPDTFPSTKKVSNPHNCSECDGVGWFWTANTGMEPCLVCDGEGTCACEISPMPSLSTV